MIQVFGTPKTFHMGDELEFQALGCSLAQFWLWLSFWGVNQWMRNLSSLSSCPITLSNKYIFLKDCRLLNLHYTCVHLISNFHGKLSTSQEDDSGFCMFK